MKHFFGFGSSTKHRVGDSQSLVGDANMNVTTALTVCQAIFLRATAI
jgi:hypothetical protein